MKLTEDQVKLMYWCYKQGLEDAVKTLEATLPELPSMGLTEEEFLKNMEQITSKTKGEE